MKLTLTTETLAELTSDQLSTVVGGAGSDSCSLFSTNTLREFIDDLPVIGECGVS